MYFFLIYSYSCIESCDPSLVSELTLSVCFKLAEGASLITILVVSPSLSTDAWLKVVSDRLCYSNELSDLSIEFLGLDGVYSLPAVWLMLYSLSLNFSMLNDS